MPARPARLPDVVVESPVLTLREAGAYLKRGRSWMLAHANEIGCVRERDRLTFRRERLDDWLALHERAPQTTGGPAPTPIRRPALKHKTALCPLDGQP